MDEPVLDAVCERLRQTTYIKGSRILSHGSVVGKMVFVVRGKLESIGEDGTRIPLSEGDVCGEELLTWYLEHSSVSAGITIPSFFLVLHRLFCWRHVVALLDAVVLSLMTEHSDKHFQMLKVLCVILFSFLSVQTRNFIISRRKFID